tara:strand:- start:175 stop:495 length:321 start_codon:yes stop_codon:yes gene_type:complete
MKSYIVSWTPKAFKKDKEVYYASNQEDAAYLVSKIGSKALVMLMIYSDDNVTETQWWELEPKKELDYIGSGKKITEEMLNWNKKTNGYVPGRYPFELVKDSFRRIR